MEFSIRWKFVKKIVRYPSLLRFKFLKLRFDHIHLIFHVAKLEARKLTASQIRLRIVYSIPTNNILVLLFQYDF